MTPGESDGAVPAERVVAVVVSYERRALVLETLAAVLGQTRPPDEVLLVDNASTDGTVAAVRAEHPAVRVLATTVNAGGAGGFTLGMDEALRRGADAVWLLDDDGVPDGDALETMLAARSRYAGGEPPALVASRVVWVDGRIHRMNVPRRRRGAGRRSGIATRAARAAAVGCTPIRSASFCSVLVDARAAEAVGLPVADYFLWNDDFEYTARLLRDRDGLLCPASRVVHKTATYYNSGSAPGGRLHLDARNMVWMLARSRGLSWPERCFFTLVTGRRFVRTAYRARDRRTHLRALVAGLVAGVRRGPRPTADVLAEIRRTIVVEPGDEAGTALRRV